MLNVPILVGVPEITPVSASNVKPAGRVLSSPLGGIGRNHSIVPPPVVALNVKVYGCPNVPAVITLELILGAPIWSEIVTV
jgi:hypothetical protein